MHSTHKAKRSGGFTLIEICLGMTVLSVAILTAVYAQSVAMSLMRASQEVDAARNELAAAMEVVLLTTHDDIVIDFPEGQSIPAFEDLHLSQQRVIPEYPNYEDGDPVPDPLEVALVVSWRNFDGRQQNLRIATLSTR